MPTFNISSPLNAPYIRQWSGSVLVQVMAWRRAIAWNNAALLSVWLLGTNFSEIRIGILSFSFTKMHLKLSSAKMAAILFRGDACEQCVSSSTIAVHHSEKCCIIDFIRRERVSGYKILEVETSEGSLIWRILELCSIASSQFPTHKRYHHNTVEIRYNVANLSRYHLRHCDGSGRAWIRV